MVPIGKNFLLLCRNHRRTMFFTRWFISKWSSTKLSDCIRQLFCKYTVNKMLVLIMCSIDLLFRNKIHSIIKTNPFPIGRWVVCLLPNHWPLPIFRPKYLNFSTHFKAWPCPFSNMTLKSLPIFKSEPSLRVTRFKKHAPYFALRNQFWFLL